MMATTLHQPITGGHPGACTCGETFKSARGRLLHQHAESRKRREEVEAAKVCSKCGEHGHVTFRIRRDLCPFCREDEDARRDDLNA